MDLASLAAELRCTFPNLELRLHEPLAEHCSFRIGGPAELFAAPADEMELSALCSFLSQQGIRPTVLGKGTNVLISDAGLAGVTVHLGERFAAVRFDGDMVYAEAGVSLAQLAQLAKERGLAGLEFAHGIPGSLGGAVLMNAGAYGGEMRDVVVSVRYMSPQGFFAETDAPDFAYRHSRFSDTDEIIVGASLRLHPDAPEAILARMLALREKRSASQPLNLPSAGSAFRRPANGFAAAMIDAAGLKGLRVGGAQVSEKHAGFIVNTGGATAADVRALIAQVQKRVAAHCGTHLEPEIRFLGSFAAQEAQP